MISYEIYELVLIDLNSNIISNLNLMTKSLGQKHCRRLNFPLLLLPSIELNLKHFKSSENSEDFLPVSKNLQLKITPLDVKIKKTVGITKHIWYFPVRG